jgi:uncharacterized LabA/DUF88 family protein
MSNKVAVLIDGFNFYHAICSHIKSVHYPRNLKWLDYDALVRKVLLKNQPIDELKINFYTAINTFKCDSHGKPHKSTVNHRVYTNALKTKNIEVIEGQFKLRDEKLNSYFVCKECNNTQFIHKLNIDFPSKINCVKCNSELLIEDFKCIKKPEEKKTDVKIAIDIVNIARDGNYNKIFLFSTDSDFIPPVEYVKKNCPNTEIIIVAPSDKFEMKKYNEKKQRLEITSAYRYGTSDFAKLDVSVLRLKLSKLINCLFEDEITSCDGKILRNPWM